MKHELPKLPYKYDELEPYIDAKTMEIHHTKHHQGYINKLNTALEGYPELANDEITDLLAKLDELPADVRTAVQNNGGGHYNHSLFWEVLTPEDSGNNTTEPAGNLGMKIIETFGSFDMFKADFEEAATKRFGSGWAWLVLDSDEQLSILTTPNQDNPISDDYTPLLGIDVWEHAYYLHYQNRRGEYLQAIWHIINWDVVEARFNEVSSLEIIEE